MVSIVIKTTEKQQEAIQAQSTHVLVRGIPGSGKTIVLVEKVKDILENEPSSKVLFITFNHTLRAYIEAQLENFDATSKLELTTYHTWAKGVLTNVLNGLGTNDFRKIDAIFKRHYNKYSSKSNYFVNKDYEKFVMEEWEWMKGKAVNSMEEYLEVARTGRGVSLGPKSRQELYAFFEQVEGDILLKNLVPHVNYGKLVMRHADKIRQVFGYTHILVDEAQDLTQAEMTSLSRVVGDNGQLVVAADLGQKIYKTEYTWKSAEINILGGRTKTLDIAHRSTKQIMDLATSLIQNDPLVKSDDQGRPQQVVREGEIPHVLRTKNDKKSVVELVKHLRKDSAELSIGILTFTNKEADQIVKEINSVSIDAKKVDKNSPKLERTKVNVMTMYGAKGLEFDVVIIPAMNERFPYLTNILEEDREEQINLMRRLLYVSMTRARNELYLIYTGEPSRYLIEMDNKLYTTKTV